MDLQLALEHGGDVTLSHHYTAEESNEPPFALSIWPNFRAQWWGLHLGYSGATPGIQFVASGVVSLEGLIHHLSAADGFSAVTAGISLLSSNVVGLSESIWLRQDRQGAKALFVLPGSAEAAVLEDRRAGAPRIAGMLLLPEPKVASVGAAGSASKVGIDFGTTNTAVYFQIGSQEPEPLRFESRHILPYRVAEQSRDELDAELLPVSQIDVPFQTILRDRRLAQSDAPRRPFRDTLIYFAQRRKAALERAVGNADDLFANLKWDDDQLARGRVELFLAQVVILALAEVGARGVEPVDVSFRFSFPEAFRPHQVQSFQAAARNAVLQAIDFVMPIATSARAAKDVSIEFQTESVAAAQYFIHSLNTPATEGLITFDIGGQTTDVAIVQSQTLGAERLAWRGSFQLAGRHLLIEHLTENRGILEQLARGRPNLTELLVSLPLSGKTSPEKRLLGTELLVNSSAFAEAIQSVLPTLAGMPDAERLRAVALAGLAGLFDYVGRTFCHLAETGRIEQRANTSVSICLGGRASLLYHALLHSEDEQTLMLKFFTEASGGAAPRARLVFSKAPKQEVAYGLVRDDRALTGRVPTEPLLGESLWCGKVEALRTDLISQLDMTKPWRIEDPPGI